ncbi:hypothetical protein GC169_06410 [bacterium]|nr:hypothetical protein [bacterium]
MLLFRIFLIAFLIFLSVYTGVVIANHGWNLFAVFFGDLLAMTWPGQFNADFLGFLMLSAIWTAWRHQYSALGLALSVAAFFGGMIFLTIYLTIETGRARGDVRELLLGRARARS